VTEDEQMPTLDERLAAHATWLRTAGDEGAPLVLTGERLAGVMLDGLDLTEAVVHDCDLTGASLRGTWLVRAELHGTTLDRADLTGARLVKAAGQDVSARETTFANADLTRLSATQWNLRSADLSRTYLNRAEFDHCDLTGARLVDADLDRTGFGGSVVAEVEAGGAEGTITSEPAHGLDATALVRLLRTAGASGVEVFDLVTFDRDQWVRWRHPLPDVPPPT
jgi:uncharacterized protein YjbI with pentapeptide repeats